MSANNTIDFWFTVGSTYTYLTVSRLHKVQAASGIRFRWRPFNARAIMQEMNNVPFATKPIKLAYMWRDVERPQTSRYAHTARGELLNRGHIHRRPLGAKANRDFTLLSRLHAPGTRAIGSARVLSQCSH